MQTYLFSGDALSDAVVQLILLYNAATGCEQASNTTK